MVKKKTARNAHIVALYKKHRSLRAVAELVNLSHERIRQILQAEKISTGR